MGIDGARTRAALAAWATIVETGAGRRHDTSFQTMDEYLEYRSMDIGYT
jgi:hypothetical protein